MGFIFWTIFLLGVLWLALKLIPKQLKLDSGDFSLAWLRFIVAGIAGFLLVSSVFTSIVMIVPQGQARVGQLFGNLDLRIYGSGINFVNPLENFYEYSTQRITMEFQAGNGGNNADDLLAQSSDKVPITIDANFNVQFNPAALPWLLSHIGQQQVVIDSLLNPTCRQAVRVGTATVTMDQAITSGRTQLAEAMRSDCESETVATLVGMGMPHSLAAHAFTFLPVQLRRVEPPQAVQQAQAERQAAQIGFERAGFIVETQQRLVAASAAQGQSLQQLQAAAPHGWSAHDIAEVNQSLALQTQASAIQQAVQGGHVPVIVTSGGSGALVQVGQGH